MLFAALLLAAPAAVAQPPSASEAEVKAAFVFRFGSFVEWPASAFPAGDSPFVIAVVGADDVARALAAIVEDRTIHGRPVRVHRVVGGESAVGHHVLFVGDAARRSFAAIRDSVAASPILLVTELEGAVRSGSMIDLVVDGDRVRFDVAPAAAEARDLKISSRVLAIARYVRPDGE